MFNVRWSRVKLVYEPSGGGEIVHRYCHLAIDGIHSAMLRTRTVSLHDYFKLTTDRQLTSTLRAEIGHEYAGKRSSKYYHARTSKRRRRFLSPSVSTLLGK